MSKQYTDEEIRNINEKARQIVGLTQQQSQKVREDAQQQSYNGLAEREKQFVNRMLSLMISEAKIYTVDLGVAQDYIDHRDHLVRLILKNRKEQ